VSILDVLFKTPTVDDLLKAKVKAERSVEDLKKRLAAAETDLSNATAKHRDSAAKFLETFKARHGG
jgi:Arc/MetJ family transcription regulator